MEIALTMMLIILSAIMGAAIIRLVDLKIMKAQHQVLVNALDAGRRAVNLNNQLLYMWQGATEEEAKMLAEADEILRWGK